MPIDPQTVFLCNPAAPLPGGAAAPQAGWNGAVTAIGEVAVTGGKRRRMRRVLLSFADGGRALAPGGRQALPLAVSRGRNGGRQLLIVQANNFFPIGLLPVSDAAVAAGADLRVPTDPGPSAAAFRLLQELIADPDSPESRRFALALIAAGVRDAAPGTAGHPALDGFADIRLDRLFLVLGYLMTWPTAWAGFQDSFSYGLYAAADAGAAAGGPAATLLGHISFRRAAGAAMFPGSMYQILHTPLVGAPMALHYLQGRLVPQAKGAAPDLSLAATYLRQGPTGEFAPAFLGYLGGKPVAALSAPAGAAPSLLGSSEGNGGGHGLGAAWQKTQDWFSQKHRTLSVGIPVGVILAAVIGWNVVYYYYNSQLTPGTKKARDNCIEKGYNKESLDALGDALLKQALEKGAVGSEAFTKEFKRLLLAAERTTPFKDRCKALWRKYVIGIPKAEQDAADAIGDDVISEIDSSSASEIETDLANDEADGTLLSAVLHALDLPPDESANSIFLEFVKERPRAGSELIRRALGRAELVVGVGEEVELIGESDQLDAQSQFGVNEQDYEVEDSLVEDGDVLRNIRSDSLRQSARSLMTVQRSLEFDELNLEEDQVSVDAAIKKNASASGNQDEVSEIEEEEQTEDAENESKINEEASEGGGSDDD